MTIENARKEAMGYRTDLLCCEECKHCRIDKTIFFCTFGDFETFSRARCACFERRSA